MIDAAFAAANQIFSPPFRAVFWKSMALTLLLLAFCAAGAWHLLGGLLPLTAGWIVSLFHVAAGLGLAIAVTFLVTPVSFIVAGFYFDELAAHVEETLAGPEGRGQAMALVPAVGTGLKFAALSVAINLLALVLLLVPGINAIAFFGANAYLLGRGYFELAALRFLAPRDVRTLRQTYHVRIFLAGCLVAALLAVPLANLVTPLFASAFFVRLAYPLVKGRATLQAMR